MKTHNRMEQSDIDQIKASVSTELAEVRKKLYDVETEIKRVTTFFIDGDPKVNLVPFTAQIHANTTKIVEMERKLRENDTIKRVNEMYGHYQDLRGSVRVTGVAWGALSAALAILAWLAGNNL